MRSECVSPQAETNDTKQPRTRSASHCSVFLPAQALPPPAAGVPEPVHSRSAAVATRGTGLTACVSVTKIKLLDICHFVFPFAVLIDEINIFLISIQFSTISLLL